MRPILPTGNIRSNLKAVLVVCKRIMRAAPRRIPFATQTSVNPDRNSIYVPASHNPKSPHPRAQGTKSADTEGRLSAGPQSRSCLSSLRENPNSTTSTPMQNLTSQAIRSLLALSQKKDNLQAELAGIDSAIVASLGSPTPAPVVAVAAPKPVPPAKTTKPKAKRSGRPAPTKAPALAQNENSLMPKLVAALEAAGEDGLTIPEIATKLSVSESVIDTLIRPFAKPGKKSKKSAAKKPGKRGPKPGIKPGGTKARILALLNEAGSKGLSTREISKKLNLSLAGVGVWFSSTGKALTTKLAPGHYALKS